MGRDSMKIIVIIVILLFNTSGNLCLSAENKEDIVNYWFEKISNGIYDINEAVLPHTSFMSHETHQYVIEVTKKQKLMSFNQFVRACNEIYNEYRHVHRGRYTVKVPKKVIVKLLNRRSPIINKYKFDRSKYKVYGSFNPKYICYATMNSQWDYLGLTQITVFRLLMMAGDIRFEKEAISFLDYFYASMPDSLDKIKMKDKDARLCYSNVQGSRLYLPALAKKYINICRLKNGKEKIENDSDLQKEYHFGTNCHYYDLNNWKEYVRRAWTQEDLKRQDEIAEEFRKQSEKRWRVKVKE